jgi:hypothetical protein
MCRRLTRGQRSEAFCLVIVPIERKSAASIDAEGDIGSLFARDADLRGGIVDVSEPLGDAAEFLEINGHRAFDHHLLRDAAENSEPSPRLGGAQS